jgi:hypothetical protein
MRQGRRLNATTSASPAMHHSIQINRRPEYVGVRQTLA